MKPKDVEMRRFIMPDEKSLGFGRRAPGIWRPDIDLCETQSAITLRAEVPGVALYDLSVKIKGDRLVLSGIKREPQVEEKPLCYIRLERVYGEFSREIEMDWPIDAERATASLQDGILTVEIPKLEKVVEVPIIKK